MVKNLSDGVLAIVQGSPLGDRDVRSALGMARSWMDNGKAIVRTNAVYGVRDDLAEELITEIRDMDREDSLVALSDAREWLNAPFTDPTMNGQKTGKAVILKPGSGE